jgi:hypothetical protein
MHPTRGAETRYTHEPDTLRQVDVQISTASAADMTTRLWGCHIISRNGVGWRTNLQSTIEIPARGGKRIRPTVADKKKAPVGPSTGSILQTTEL